MTAPIIAFFNNKGGVGKTSLVYHLAWMFADLGLDVLAADLDPQANLTSVFLSEEECFDLWSSADNRMTVYGAVQPMRGVSDFSLIPPTVVSNRIRLLPGDLELSIFEDVLADQWTRGLNDDPRAAYILSVFYRLIRKTAEAKPTDVILLDVGPSLGAINRAALIASDFVVIPLGADLFSIQALRNVGPRLRQWRGDWAKRRGAQSSVDISLPEGKMLPLGYVLIQHAARLDRPTKAYEQWASRVPDEYVKSVQGPATATGVNEVDPCLAQLRHYRSLMPMAQQARKPIFHLTSADGAIGAHQQAVRDVGKEFQALAKKIMERAGLGSRAS